MQQKQKILWLMSGVPGSGKSTYAKYMAGQMQNSVYVSRDVIRYSLITDNDHYFSKENEVFNKFVSQINHYINHPEVMNIFVDATHLDERSRNKLLDRLNVKGIVLNALNIVTPLDVCKQFNAKRSGRENVPEDVIEAMYKRFVPTSHNEKYDFSSIINVDMTHWEDYNK